jgi:hypothetical protein
MWPFNKKKKEVRRQQPIARGHGFYQSDSGFDLGSAIVADAILDSAVMFQDTAPVIRAEADYSPSYDSGSSYDSGGGCSCDCGGGGD